MSYETINLTIADGIAELVLNRPDRLNSFNAAMHEDVATALGVIDARADVRALLITGAGRAFSAGQDLGERKTDDDEPLDLGHSIETQYNPLVRILRSLPLPVVCAVNGVAAGASANIALACDIVLAARSAKFVQAFCKIGLIPDSGGTWFLPRLVGPARAAAMALLGDPVSAEDAAAWGLIYRVVDDDKLLPEAREMCAHFARQPTRCLAEIKKALHYSLHQGLDAQLDYERDVQRELGRSDDFREGVAAFLEKRTPRFTR